LQGSLGEIGIGATPAGGLKASIASRAANNHRATERGNKAKGVGGWLIFLFLLLEIFFAN
jgi:hypothetical protein